MNLCHRVSFYCRLSTWLVQSNHFSLFRNSVVFLAFIQFNRIKIATSNPFEQNDFSDLFSTIFHYNDRISIVWCKNYTRLYGFIYVTLSSIKISSAGLFVILILQIENMCIEHCDGFIEKSKYRHSVTVRLNLR